MRRATSAAGARWSRSRWSARTAITPDPARAGAVSAYCHSQGVVTLTCGTYGNVLRFLPPLVISDALLDEAFDVVAAGFDETA